MAVRTGLRAFGVELARYPALHRACDILVGQGGMPTFLQIGAHDGVLNDDVSPLVRRYGLSGVVVEPVPAYFATLREVYARLPQVVCVQAAVHPTLTQAEIFFVRPECATIAWHHGLASFDRQNILSHGLDSGAVDSVVVPCLSVDRLIQEHFRDAAPDILVVDTEGFDAEVLSMVDWAAHRPRFVQFERKHLPASVQADWAAKLRGMGYRLSWTYDDCMAGQPEVVSPLAHLRASF